MQVRPGFRVEGLGFWVEGLGPSSSALLTSCKLCFCMVVARVMTLTGYCLFLYGMRPDAYTVTTIATTVQYSTLLGMFVCVQASVGEGLAPGMEARRSVKDS